MTLSKKQNLKSFLYPCLRNLYWSRLLGHRRTYQNIAITVKRICSPCINGKLYFTINMLATVTAATFCCFVSPARQSIGYQFHSAFSLVFPNYRSEWDNSSRATTTCRSSVYGSQQESPFFISESLSSGMLSPISDISCSNFSSTTST